MIHAAIVAALMTVVPLCSAHASGADIAIDATRVIWNPDNRAEKRTGKLEFLAGFELTANDPRFGGFSGLTVSADGAKLLAVSDEGVWLTATLIHDAGRLADVGTARLVPMRDEAGAPLRGKRHIDAEEIAVVGTDRPDTVPNTVYVAFERRHRIARYDLAPHDNTGAGLDAAAASVLEGPPLDRLTNNSGIEALTVMPADTANRRRLLALSEDSVDEGGNLIGFLIEGSRAEPLAVRPDRPYKPTGLAHLPGGDLLLLERRYSRLGGVGMQIRRIGASTVRPGAVLDGPVLIEVGQRYAIDNMEAIAVRTGVNGDKLIYLLSDDNFNPLQRTLLLQFRLIE